MNDKSETAKWLNWFIFDYQTGDSVMKFCVITFTHVGGFGSEKSIGDAKLADYTGYERKAVQRAMRRAEALGLVKYGEKRGRAYRRTLTLARPTCTAEVQLVVPDEATCPAEGQELALAGTADVPESPTITGSYDRSQITDNWQPAISHEAPETCCACDKPRQKPAMLCAGHLAKLHESNKVTTASDLAAAQSSPEGSEPSGERDYPTPMMILDAEGVPTRPKRLSEMTRPEYEEYKATRKPRAAA